MIPAEITIFRKKTGRTLVFSRNLTKNFLLAAATAGLLGSCGIFKTTDNGEPAQSIWVFSDRAAEEANLATVAYSQGKFPEAEEHIVNALQLNPKQPQALMVGGMLYEQIGRPNRARQYYEDLIVLNGNETTILGSKTGNPEKMSDIAKKRLRMINVKQSELVIEEKDGAKVFNISDEAAKRQSKSAIAEALFLREKKLAADNKPSSEEEIKAVEVLFDDNEQNMISRFLILKELAEKDLVTKEEFLNARMANVGALLPLTHTAPAYGIDRKVPSPDLIIERISVLKDAVEARAITPREFSAERNLIIEALLPPTPRQRMRNKTPSKDIMGAAKDLRKLEVLYDLNLITSKEKQKEQKAIEKYLGINRAEKKAEASQIAAKQPAPAAKPADAAPVVPLAENATKEVIETQTTITETTPLPQPDNSPAPTPLLPPVSSPF